MDRTEQLRHQLGRHNRDRRVKVIESGVFMLGNCLGLIATGAGFMLNDRQFCARDPLCEMTPEVRRSTRMNTKRDDRLIDLTTVLGGAIIVGDLAYLVRGRSR